MCNNRAARLFAMHLEHETNGQIKVSRLTEQDPQHLRCVQAATKKHQQMHVLQVYKIENQPLFHAWEQFVEQSTQSPKVKGLFCSIPLECVEHCLVYGMNVALTPSVFTRTMQNEERDDVLLSMNQYAQLRILESRPVSFPRRFSRYSTQWKGENDQVVSYMALCRVEMGETHRVTSSALKSVDIRTLHATIGSLYVEDEGAYVIRYAEAVVPEFLIEYQVIQQPVEMSEMSMPSEVEMGEVESLVQALYPLREVKAQVTATKPSVESMLEEGLHQRQAITAGLRRIQQQLWSQLRSEWRMLCSPRENIIEPLYDTSRKPNKLNVDQAPEWRDKKSSRKPTIKRTTISRAFR